MGRDTIGTRQGTRGGVAARRASAVLALALAGGLLAGCGGTDSAAPRADAVTATVPASPAPTTTAAPVAPGGPSRTAAPVPAGPSATTPASPATTPAPAAARPTATPRPARPAQYEPPQARTAGATATAGFTGALAGMQCRAAVTEAYGAELRTYDIAGPEVTRRAGSAPLGFAPLMLARGGEMGDAGSGLAAYLAFDASGALHYVEVERRSAATSSTPAAVLTDVVLSRDYAGARALGASVVMHWAGEPEVFVVDAQGRLLRHTISAAGLDVTLSAPTVLATGLTGASAMSVEDFDVDGDVTVDGAVATRVLVADGTALRQVIVQRDGTASAVTTLLTAPELAGAKALTRAQCAVPGARVDGRGALLVFGADGSATAFGGSYDQATAAPQLAPVGRVAAVGSGRLAG